MAADERFFAAYFDSYLSQFREVTPAALERQHPTLRHYFGRWLPAARDARILDLGCGYGPVLHFLHAEGYALAEGVDVSREQVELARAAGIANVHEEDAGSFLDRHPDTYDCILAIDVIEHLPKEDALPMLDRIRSALRPGGRLILQAPNAGGPFGARHRYIDFTHSFALLPSSATQILRVAGFTDIRVLGTDPRVHGPVSLLRAAVWSAIKALLWVYQVAETGIPRGHVFTQNLIAVARRPD